MKTFGILIAAAITGFVGAQFATPAFSGGEVDKHIKLTVNELVVKSEDGSASLKIGAGPGGYFGLWMSNRRGEAAHIWLSGGSGPSVGLFKDWNKIKGGCEVAISAQEIGTGTLQILSNGSPVIVGGSDLKPERLGFDLSPLGEK